MDVSGLVGEELKLVCFVEDYLELGFGEAKVSFFAWPYVLLPDFSVAFGEPEYRNALCEEIGKLVKRAFTVEKQQIKIEFEDGSSISISLKPEDYRGPEAAYLVAPPRPTCVW